MRTSDADILFLPDEIAPGAGHWLRRWQSRLSTARLLDHAGDMPSRVAELRAAFAPGVRPVVVIGHGTGIEAFGHAFAHLPRERIAGAFLVGPRVGAVETGTLAIGPTGLLIASSNSPHCPLPLAQDIAQRWQVPMVDAGEAGGFDEASGHGPWPEGLLRFASFMARL